MKMSKMAQCTLMGASKLYDFNKFYPISFTIVEVGEW